MEMYNPPHPGEIIQELCINALGITVTDAAKSLGVTKDALSALFSGRSGITPEMALRLSKVFGRTPEGWLRLQFQYDLWQIRQNVDLSNLKPIHAAA